MPDEPPTPSYSMRIRRWTTLGVVAIILSSVALTMLLVVLARTLLHLPAALTGLIPVALGMAAVVCALLGGILGMLACLVGSFDMESRTDARLGLWAIGFSAISGGVLFALMLNH